MNVVNILKEKNVRPSYLRIKILEYLMSVKTHPTAEEIYDELINEIPTLSKTSIYNTMKLFVDLGLSKLITIEGQQARFDGDTSLHGHFLCDNCKNVYDFPVKITSKLLDGFDVKTKEVYYSGTCKNCLEKKYN